MGGPAASIGRDPRPSVMAIPASLSTRRPNSAGGACGDRPEHPGNPCVGSLVFPDPDHGPPRSGEHPVCVPVALDVGHDLPAPPLAVCFRPAGMLGASVPEAPVDEYRYPAPAKDHVSTPTTPCGAPIDPISQA